MPLSSTIHLHPPTSPSSKPPSVTYLIYHITGNPGLIEYYRTFLTHLYGSLSKHAYSPPPTSPPSIEFQVFGRSLSGFEVDGSPNLRDVHGSPPYGLEEQIAESERCLTQLVESARNGGSEDVRVVLMGHSVGSYILLELIRRVRERGDDVRIVGGVCLFPTVTHIAESNSGKKASPILALPSSAYLISLLAKALSLLLPVPALSSLIKTFMRFPSDAAHVTASFVKSRHGVHQALHMAHDEMQTITADRWDDEIWGAVTPSPHSHRRPVLRFLFADEDHWVANETRDDLMRVRSSMGTDDEPWKPKMEIDETHGWPHGFCIKHSVPVAERVCGYVEDIVQRDLEGPYNFH